MLSFLWDLASFIVALGVLITVHEFGHFWVARRCGVRVERFSIGFGKALWRRTDKLGTEYVIALIPLGGYVKMLDERAEPVVPELRHHAFNNKSVGQRAAIIAAGPVANFIFAIFAYWLVFIIGVPGVRPVVGEIAANSIAAVAQIAPGTELKAVTARRMPVGVEEAIEGMSVQYSAASQKLWSSRPNEWERNGSKAMPPTIATAPLTISSEKENETTLRNCCGLLLVKAGVPY